jgi:hypothetical protein
MSESEIIELYLTDKMHPADRIVMETRIILEDKLREKVSFQKKTYAMIQNYGRKMLRRELESVDRQLFSEKRYASFQQKIRNIFKGI